MKAASAQEIKQKLKELSAAQLSELCLRLTRFKKENKELLTYLLFEEDNIEGYIKNVKDEMEEQFSSINLSNLYFAKKTLRKILRSVNKYIRYTGNKTVETELLLLYLIKFKELQLPLNKNTALRNIFEIQTKKLSVAISVMHEDLQYQYRKELDSIIK